MYLGLRFEVKGKGSMTKGSEHRAQGAGLWKMLLGSC